MKNLFGQHKYFLVVVALYLLAEVLVNPIGNFPLNDDWSYARALCDFKETGVMNPGRIPAMSLLTHILWGSVFTSVFGFSFTVLRFSTIISALLGAIVLYRLCEKISGNKKVSAFSALVLLFNPLHFSLSNSFMTDVNFNTLCILSFYCIYEYFKTKRSILIPLIFILSCALTLLRQYGLVVPAAFVLGSFFVQGKKWLPVLFALVILITVFIIYRFYESYLRTVLPPGAEFIYSDKFSIGQVSFWQNILSAFSERYRMILLHLLFYSSPLALVFVRDIASKLGKKRAAVFFLVGIVLCTLMFINVSFPFHNILCNLTLGPETFYESWYGSKHWYFPFFAELMNLLKVLLPSITLFVLTGATFWTFKNQNIKSFLTPFPFFVLTFVAAYCFMLLNTESFFDRYHLPIISALLLMLAGCSRNFTAGFVAGVVLMLPVLFLSVGGTRDYLELNRKRWEACNFLLDEKKISAGKINGGYEVNGWLQKNDWGYYSFQNLENCDYLIQFRKEKGFTLMKEFEFTRWLPPARDKINIFVRDSLSN